nr:hypothetical protein CFP56_09704 [Quercus suber]
MINRGTRHLYVCASGDRAIEKYSMALELVGTDEQFGAAGTSCCLGTPSATIMHPPSKSSSNAIALSAFV